ncbi:MAG TPA: 4-hydroxy-tetrahydrodipicolinate synthase [Candidatus Limadaptatus stercoripullorum]|uniref:4-hydroxy-tetrahydrodipicolinate synthase n=1 Tax=Candidatus Limadaptatus stercoripullorum TaxID=2840846 RepID=A0A9D1NAC7_9FIRM|nr:4-hydroxy-tetrahydrodipicolinate synthase [Candidatus Limadaptatus stercoripullorum]
MIFKGTATALITPFTADGVDLDAFGKLLDEQVAGGVSAVVVLGTTGEPATMTASEKLEVMKFAIRRFKGVIPVIIGTGSNNTAAAVELSVQAEKLGADALLVVTPYYNKATQRGLIAHYTAIADAVNIPIICYNVPGRTGVNLLPATFAELAEHPNIAAIKEASGNMEQIEEVIRLTRGKAVVYSGDDGITVPVMAMGGMGVISVASNVAPKFTSEMTSAALAGDYAKAADMQLRMLPFVRALFSEVNPIPVKKAAELKGICAGTVRLPLTPMTDENAAKLAAILPDFD